MQLLPVSINLADFFPITQAQNPAPLGSNVETAAPQSFPDLVSMLLGNIEPQPQGKQAPARSDKSEKSEKPDISDRSEKPEEFDKREKPERPEMPEMPLVIVPVQVPAPPPVMITPHLDLTLSQPVVKEEKKAAPTPDVKPAVTLSTQPPAIHLTLTPEEPIEPTQATIPPPRASTGSEAKRTHQINKHWSAAGSDTEAKRTHIRDPAHQPDRRP